MARTATLSTRVDPELKKQAEELYADFGLSLSDAINVFLHQSVRVGGLPFQIRRPSPELMDAMAEVEAIREGRIEAKKYDSVSSMMADILSD